MASMWGHTPTVKILAQHGADLSKCRTDIGFPSLLLATWKGHAPTVAALLAYGADPSFATTQHEEGAPIGIYLDRAKSKYR